MTAKKGVLSLLGRVKDTSSWAHVPVIWDVGRRVRSGGCQALFEVHRFGTAVKITISPEVFVEDRETLGILHSALKAAGEIYSGSTTATRVWTDGTPEEGLSVVTDEAPVRRKRTVREQLADALAEIERLKAER